jgi:adenosylcobinamide kinase/adenosylcobinamide-phosphate guanylyltransferase
MATSDHRQTRRDYKCGFLLFSMKTTEIPTKSLLVLGAARSGKSRYAQKLAESSGLEPVLIATAEPLDEEMAARIARHKARRSARWTVIEEPAALTETLFCETRKNRIVVADCVTLWLSNLFARGDNVCAATQHLAKSIASLGGPVVFVSNEVGAGIVPENPLARAFRDAQGLLNQQLAQACEAAVLVAAGIALRLKPAPEPEFRF